MSRDVWILSFTPQGSAGKEIGRFATRDDAMIADENHFEKATGSDDGLGWQMSFNGATALTGNGAYRVRRA